MYIELYNLEHALSQAIECKNMNESNCMTDYSDNIGIIGGGIAGLTLGCSLLKEGIPATIFEKMPEEISHGAALSLSSNALRLLNRLDIYDDLKNQYISLEGIERLKINSELNGLKAILDSNGLGGFYCLIAEKI